MSRQLPPDWCCKHNSPSGCFFCHQDAIAEMAISAATQYVDPFDLPLVYTQTEKNTCDCGGFKCKTTHANWCKWRAVLDRREKEKEVHAKWRSGLNNK